ncbi:uncharacterized transmembrane protein DDB_G0289901-like isoform X2 [Hemicordylus capensis]|uniref:uncharacterized transmembrane protein DDB_G0289901-like isoform X2 n=1 Tax=Hemicordylus capensis TaxID=884348 RepID=UPI0023038D04|nr:uncharacterized transmembrane protein DDB_G0289901-like isoform X2 [Hemicordylus capensis]
MAVTTRPTLGNWCPEAARTQISCVGEQEQCMDLDITGNMGQFSNMKLKGCANLLRCQETLSFYSGSRTIHASCCDTPLCNSFTPDLHVLSQATNGLECYSCVDEDGIGCSEKVISKVQCTGIHNMCLEGIGNSRKPGMDYGLVTFKGCASSAMCQSSLLALVQELDNTDVLCCQGSLCNTRIVNGVVTEPKIAADSADTSERPECITPTPSNPTPDPDCIYDDDEDSMVVAGAVPPPESHNDKETVHMTNEKEGRENYVAEGSTVSPRDHSVTGEHMFHENLSGGSSESHAGSTTSVTNSEHVATGGSAAATDLDRSDSGAGTTSSGNHGNVVVLVPIVVPKNATRTTSSFSSGTVTTLATSDEDGDDEECEAEEEGAGTEQPFIAVNAGNAASPESNRESSFSPRPAVILRENESTRVPVGGHSNAGVSVTGGHYDGATESTSHGHTVHSHGTAGESFISGGNPASHTPGPGHSATGSHGATNVEATGGTSFATGGNTPQPGHASSAPSEEHGTHTHLHVPYIMSRDKNSFLSEGNTEAGAPAETSPKVLIATSSPDKEVLVSGAGAATTARPKNKKPCKRPGSPNKPEANVVPSSAANKRAAKEGIARETTNLMLSDTKGGGKVGIKGGAFGLSAHFGLFSLTLLLAALLH